MTRLCTAAAIVAHAQSYSSTWSTIDGGVFSVSGTIGQPDVGLSITGGNYSLAGGFLGIISVA